MKKPIKNNGLNGFLMCNAPIFSKDAPLAVCTGRWAA